MQQRHPGPTEESNGLIVLKFTAVNLAQAAPDASLPSRRVQGVPIGLWEIRMSGSGSLAGGLQRFDRSQGPVVLDRPGVQDR